LARGQAGADGHARAQALGQGHDVRLDAGVLVGEPLAGAADATLHLVEHEQPVLLVAELAQALQEFLMAEIDAASPWITSNRMATILGLCCATAPTAAMS